MAQSTVPPVLETVTLTAAMRLAKTSNYQILKGAILGRIRTISEPGMTTRYVKEDVIKFAASKAGN